MAAAQCADAITWIHVITPKRRRGRSFLASSGFHDLTSLYFVCVYFENN